jgi:exosortase A
MPAHLQSNINATRVAWFATAIAITSILIFLHETFLSMLRQWDNSGSYTYCYLIAPAALFLAWVRREKLLPVAPRASTLGLFASFSAAIVWIIGSLTQIDIIQQIAAVLLIGFSIWAVLGTEIARVMIYPLAYLLFMVPTGGFLISPLMEWTADFTLFATQLSGVPIFRDGMLLSIPEGDFNVAEACSGLRALLVFSASGVFFAGVVFQSAARRATFIVISLVVPLIANGARAYGIVMLGHFSDMRWTVNHILLGDIWFGFVLLMMCLVGRRYSDLDSKGTVPAQMSTGVTTNGTAWRSTVSAGVSIFIVALTPFVGAAIQQQLDNRPAETMPDLPTKTEPWSLSSVSSPDWAPVFSNATQTISGQYRSGDRKMDVRVISYLAESGGAEMINSLNRLFDHEDWRQIERLADTVKLSPDHSLPYVAILIRSKTDPEQSRIVWYWYVADNRTAVDPFYVKLLETINLLAAKKSISSLVALSTRAGGDTAAARTALEEFLTRFCGAAIAGPVPARMPLCGH